MSKSGPDLKIGIEKALRRLKVLFFDKLPGHWQGVNKTGFKMDSHSQHPPGARGLESCWDMFCELISNFPRELYPHYVF